jgi:hypothetical protein
LINHASASVRKKFAEFAKQHSLVGRPDAVEDLLNSLQDAPPDATRPGVLAARVPLLGHLANLGRRTIEEVQDAMTDALDALGEVADPLARSQIRFALAIVWCPPDQTNDRVSDFARAAELLLACVAEEGGEEQATEDTLAALARALLYAPTRDLPSNLKEAKRLYEVCLQRAMQSGNADTLALRHHDLSVVESQLGTGGRLPRLQASEEHAQKAVLLTRSLRQKAQYTAHLAWVQTQIGMHLDVAMRSEQFGKALATFSLVDFALLDGHVRGFVEGNRTVCEALLARQTGGRDAEISVWRRRLGELGGSDPYSLATAKHNLAQALLSDEGVSRDQFAEGLDLLSEAAKVRTVAANAPVVDSDAARCAALDLLNQLRDAATRTCSGH